MNASVNSIVKKYIKMSLKHDQWIPSRVLICTNISLFCSYDPYVSSKYHFVVLKHAKENEKLDIFIFHKSHEGRNIVGLRKSWVYHGSSACPLIFNRQSCKICEKEKVENMVYLYMKDEHFRADFQNIDLLPNSDNTYIILFKWKIWKNHPKSGQGFMYILRVQRSKREWWKISDFHKPRKKCSRHAHESIKPCL